MTLGSRRQLSRVDKATIKEIVARREPQLVSLMDVLEVRELTTEERESLREAIATELTHNGLAGDEPNDYGLLLEALIDRLGHF